MEIICVALTLFVCAIILRFVLSWFPITPGSFMESAHGVIVVATDWALVPLRRVLPAVRVGSVAIDLSPLILIFGVQLLQGLLCRSR